MNPSLQRESKLFGTDGVRGVANVEPVTAETALKLGRAAAHWFKTSSGSATQEGHHQIIIEKTHAFPVTCSKMQW